MATTEHQEGTYEPRSFHGAPAEDGGADGGARGMREGARDLGRALDEIGARGFDRVADALERAGDAIEARAGGVQGARSVAEPLRRAGRYAAAQTPGSALADLDGAIERHPYRSLAVGVGVGWAIGRLTRRIRAG